MEPEILLATIQAGVALLLKEKVYKQRGIVGKCRTLNYRFSEAALSRIMKASDAKGLPKLREAAMGVQALVRQELGCVYDEKQRQYVPMPDMPVHLLVPVPETKEIVPNLEVYPEGRWRLDKKTAFMTAAQYEVVEVGIRLRSFAHYFEVNNDAEYRQPIVRLLQRGVHFTGYVLDPHSSMAKAYFDDRAQVAESEARNAAVEAQNALEKLKILAKELNSHGYKGLFRLFTYRHYPQNLFLLVDPHTDTGRMAVSHYLYGVRRAECPVLAFSKKEQPQLFRKYMRSFDAIRAKAELVI